eukprot:scaffold70477_cov51-Cyclotella_meneghiniana.AAC.3
MKWSCSCLRLLEEQITMTERTCSCLALAINMLDMLIGNDKNLTRLWLAEVTKTNSNNSDH